MRALISSYAFIRLSVLVLDFPHLSLRRHGAFTLLIWLFSLNCRQLKSCHVRVEEKGNEYGTPSQRGLQRPLVEFWGFLSPNHWKAQRSFDSVSFFSFSPPPPVPRLVCTWLPKCWPRGFKNAKPSLSRLLNFRDLWQWGETFCRGFGALPGWPRQLSPLLSRTEEWWEGGWVYMSRQPSGGGQIFAMPLGEVIQASSPH